MRKKNFLRKFYEDKAKQTIYQCAIAKTINLKDEKKFKFYSNKLNELEKEMTSYINKNIKLVNRIDFQKETFKYRIEEFEQRLFTLEIIGKEMNIDQLQEWVEEKEW